MPQPRRAFDLNPFGAFEWYTGFEDSIPDIIEFVCSDAYLDRGNLYPRQATFLKTLFLQDELFSDYDFEVLGQWAQQAIETRSPDGYIDSGVCPDILDRIKLCKEQERKWFRESIVVIGRRGSKGHLGALSGAYVLWHYLAKGNPQEHYGIDRDKKLAILVFGGKKEQARDNQWADLSNVLLGAPCYESYIARALRESLSIYAPHDFVKIQHAQERGRDVGEDMATFQILPKESTPLAGRGPAAFGMYFDEMAHVVKAVASADAKEIWDAATPALDTFGKDAFIYEPSSPWQRLGQFYENYERVFQVREDGVPAYPASWAIQLTSWDIYEDWKLTNDPALKLSARSRLTKWHTSSKPSHSEESPIRRKEVLPSIFFQPLKQAIQEFNDEMRLLEEANPETFRVERRSHWAHALNAYLSPLRIAQMWQPWLDDTPLVMQERGILSRSYRAHIDPSKSGANMGFSIAHTEYHPLHEQMMRQALMTGESCSAVYRLPHVVFDVIHAWRPGDYPDNNYEVDYDAVEVDLKGFFDAFIPSEVSYDQYPMGATPKHLREHAVKRNYPKRIEIWERTATHDLNWRTWEAFKTALGLNLVHGPFHDLANAELTFVQDTGKRRVEPPSSGPIRTKDIADCLAINTYELIGDEVMNYAEELSNFGLQARQPGGVEPFGSQLVDIEVNEAFSQFSRGLRGREIVGVPRRPRGPR